MICSVVVLCFVSSSLKVDKACEFVCSSIFIHKQLMPPYYNDECMFDHVCLH